MNPRVLSPAHVGLVTLASALALAACGGSSHTAPDGGGPDPDGGLPPDGGSGAGGMIVIHVRTNAEPFDHMDGLSGQTPRDAYQGIRSFELMNGPDDPEPWRVFDHGDDYVETGYNDGDDTVVGMVPIATLRPGHYTQGRTVVTHSRYRVDATMHASGLTLPGEFDNIQVLSDRTMIDGVVRDQSWFRYIFRTAGRDYPLEGMGAPLPVSPTTTGGFRLVLEGGEAAYYYPVDLTIEPVPDGDDLHIVMEVNMDRAFRWEEQDMPGFETGVFDTTPTSYEPVIRFGANSLDVYLE